MAQADTQAHPFDALHREFMIDLNGDGVPDATVQAPAGVGGVMQLRGDAMPAVSNRERRGIQNRALAGRDPTPQEQGWLDADMPRLQQNGADLGGAALELTGLPSIGRGAGNIASGYESGDGWQMAGGVGQVALGALPGASTVRSAAPVVNALSGSLPRLAATGAAGAVPLGISEAQSASNKGMSTAIEGDPEIARIRKQIEAKQKERNQAQTSPIQGMNRQSADVSRAAAAAAIQGDLDQLQTQLREAEGRVRDNYSKNAPFRERYPGAAEALVYGGMGLAGALPFAETIKRRAADFALGRPGPTRLEEVGSFGKNALAGSFAAFEGSGLPDQIDAAAFDPGHPVRERARAALTSSDYYASRIPAALLSGTGMAFLGTELGRLATPGPRRTPGGSGPSQPTPPVVAPPPVNPVAPPPPTPQAYRSYTDLPPSARRPVQEAYLADRSMRGGDLPAPEGAQAIKDSLSRQGVNVPVTPKRVQATNDIIGQFTNAFFQANGRLPTRQELMSAFTRTTLAAPFAVGGMNALSPQYGGE